MPDEFLTIDEVAQRMALPPDMIRRRIESGDIPVHWVESYGKLEMRVAAADVGGAPAAPPAEGQYAAELPAEPSWAPVESDTPGLWAPAAPEDDSSNPWEVAPEAPVAPQELDDVPVWRPDPATWEDEELADTASAAAEPAAEPAGFADAAEQALGATGEPEIDRYPPAAEDEDLSSPFAAAAVGEETGGGFQPPDLGPGFQAPPAPGFLEQDEEPAAAGTDVPFGADFEPAAVEEYGVAGAQLPVEDEPFAVAGAFAAAEPSPPPPTREEIAPPSTLLASPAAASAAVGAIDARELVAGLFERWERALEQRIQAEQRLRFEAELEQRLRQVRDLRQELEQTRKTQAAELAEREREVLQLREQVRELEKAPKRRGLFGR